MKRFSVFIIFSIALFSLPFIGVHAQKRPAAKTSKVQPATKIASKPVYDTKAFDPSVEKLPPHYLGNDPEAIFSALIGRKDNAEKGEYETTEAFQQRLTRLRSAPLIGGLSVNSVFALKGKDVETSYDADKGVLNVAVVLERVIEGGSKPLVNYDKRGSIDSPNRSVVLKDSLESRKYPATNSFGVKTIVQELSSDDFLIEIDNWWSFQPTKYFPEGAGRDIYNRDLASGNQSLIKASETLFSRDAFIIPINVDAATAKRIRANLRVLFVSRLKEPFVSAVSRDTEATVSKPTAYKMRYYYLNAELFQALVYDVTTGEIYKRITNEDFSLSKGNSSNLNIPDDERKVLTEQLRNNRTARLATEAHLAKLKEIFDDFPQAEYDNVYPLDQKKLTDRTQSAANECGTIGDILPPGKFRIYLCSTSVILLEALMMRIEAEGKLLFSDAQRQQSIRMHDLENVPKYQRPVVILEKAKNLHRYVSLP